MKHPIFLVDQTKHPADLLAHPVRVLPDFGIDQLGVDLRGDDGLVPRTFCRVSSGMPWPGPGSQRYDVRHAADADTAAGLLADTFQTVLHTPYFPHGEHPVRRNLEFVHPPVFLDQLDGYREQLDNIGALVFTRFPTSQVFPSESVWTFR